VPTEVISILDLKKQFESSPVLFKCLQAIEKNKSVPQKETLLEQRPYSQESNTTKILWNRTAITCTTGNKDFSEVMLDDLGEINKKLNKKDALNNV